MEKKHTPGIASYTVFADHHVRADEPAHFCVEHPDDGDVEIASFEQFEGELKAEQIANADFMLLAWNSYEANQAKIKALTEACNYTKTLFTENVGQSTHALALIEAALAKE